jgi:hypothetical protein
MPPWFAPLVCAATVILVANGALGVRRLRERGLFVRLRFRLALRRWDGRIGD